MARQLLLLAGPHAQQPGSTLAIFDSSAWWHGIPWDVACVGSSLFVTLHNGDTVDTADDCRVAEVQVVGSGAGSSARLVGLVRSPLLRQANMMCVFR